MYFPVLTCFGFDVSPELSTFRVRCTTLQDFQVSVRIDTFYVVDVHFPFRTYHVTTMAGVLQLTKCRCQCQE
ncbi:MAG: hypothetical protein U0L04_05410, partial [Bacteroidaceae bacterium]|nr:hypothetical protein [Bacteroidaceae bacterium]